MQWHNAGLFVVVLLSACAGESSDTPLSSSSSERGDASDASRGASDASQDVSEAGHDNRDAHLPEAEASDGPVQDADAAEACHVDAGCQDGGVCGMCADALSVETSLDCFCQYHACPATFTEALAQPKWTQVAVGCGDVILSVPWGVVGDAEQFIFGPNQQLVGALVESDVSDGTCYTPVGDGSENATGGDVEHAVDEWEQTMRLCSEARYCALQHFDSGTASSTDSGLENGADAGGWASSPSAAGPCNEAELLALFGDAGG